MTPSSLPAKSSRKPLRQTLLRRYFHYPPKPPPTGPSFLDLLYSVRHRIYILAGLVRAECPIDFNYRAQDRADQYDDDDDGSDGDGDGDGEAPRPRPSRCRRRHLPYEPMVIWNQDDIDCVCPPLPTALLYVSRVVSRECVQILYSENKFKISWSRRRGFLPLHGLSHVALASLVSLTIRLNRCPCRPSPTGKLADEHPDCNGGSAHDLASLATRLNRCPCRPTNKLADEHPDCKGGSALDGDTALAGIFRSDKSVLEDWSTVCIKLSASIRPSQLRLFVICDTASYEVAQRVVEPLSGFPALAACAIRLGQVPDERLRRLAETTVRRLTAQPLPKAPVGRESPTQLPLEILRRVWYFTDLIAPQDLSWEASQGFMPFRCNGHCTDAPEACCCPANHAAFSSSPCTTSCWKLPTELFLVSRSLRSEAERLFYGRNDFTLLPLGTCLRFLYLTERNAPPSLHAFLSAIPGHCVRHLRSLKVEFPAMDEGFFASPGVAADARSSAWWWGRGAELLLSHGAMLPEMTLILDMSSQRFDFLDTVYMPAAEVDAAATRMRLLYHRIVEELVDLQPQTCAQASGRKRERPLKNLFVYLSWPVELRKSVERVRAANEDELERLVMGTGYDAMAEGKPVMEPVWSGLVDME